MTINTDARNTHATSASVNGAPTLKETLYCVSFLVLGNAIVLSVLVFLEPHKRPMPIQHLEASSDYVRRLTNNELYEGETLDTGMLLLFFCICPVAIQM